MADDRLLRDSSSSARLWSTKGGLQNQTIGRSRGGLSTKVHLICDSHGNPLDFVLTGGQTHDCTQSCTLLLGRTAVAVLADKGYDDNRTRGIILDMGSEVVIPPRSCRKTPIEYDRYLYRARHAVENLFAKLKHFRSLATRYDKTTRNYAAMVAIACMVIWLRL